MGFIIVFFGIYNIIEMSLTNILPCSSFMSSNLTAD